MHTGVLPPDIHYAARADIYYAHDSVRNDVPLRS